MSIIPPDAGDGREVTHEQPEVVDAASTVGPSGDGVGVESPAKIIRVGSMVKQLLEEVRSTPLDEAARDHLTAIHRQSIEELQRALSPELAAELDRLTPEWEADEIPTEAQLRIAQAQLVGWLEGLFHGIQATLVAQQMAARQQLEGMRSALPPGQPSMPPGGAPSGPSGYI